MYECETFWGSTMSLLRPGKSGNRHTGALNRHTGALLSYWEIKRFHAKKPICLPSESSLTKSRRKVHHTLTARTAAVQVWMNIKRTFMPMKNVIPKRSVFAPLRVTLDWYSYSTVCFVKVYSCIALETDEIASRYCSSYCFGAATEAVWELG